MTKNDGKMTEGGPMVLGSHPALDRLTSADAESLRLRASQIRASMAQLRNPDPLFAAEQFAHADALDRTAAGLLDPAARKMPVRDLRITTGGEAVPLPREDAPIVWKHRMHTARQSPDLLSVDASLDRLELASDARVLNLALDTAETSGADGAVGKMLAHKLAAAHRLGMRLDAAANSELDSYDREREWNSRKEFLAEAVRCAAASARVMDAFARAALALDRLKNGGRQHMIVQHVTVSDGGRAVVAGAVGAEGKA